MRFSLDIPPVSALRAEKGRVIDLGSGTELHRIHPDRFASTGFNDTDRGDARFSPIRNARGEIIPTIYAARSFRCAAAEIVFRCPDTPAVDPRTGAPPLQNVFPSDYAAYAHSVVRTTADLRLLDLTGGGQRQIGVDRSALVAGPRSTYPATRAWAKAIHAARPEVQGLLYTSHQLGPEEAFLLFGDRVPSPLAHLSSRALNLPACHADLVALADDLSITFVDI